MDHKTWIWRKKLSEKTIVANNKSDYSSQGNEEEILGTEKEASLEKSLEILNEKLESVLCDSKAKDELLEIHAKVAEEATAGRDKAEAEAASLRQELDKASLQREALNERLTQLNTALKDSMKQLSSARKDHEQRIHSAVIKTSIEFEKSQKSLEEKLTEKSRKLANLTDENARLSKALLLRENLIEDLSKSKSRAEAEFDMLMARLDSVEKENAFLKYEFRVLEKELEIRNEESEFKHKQHSESAKKIGKLEAECQRLRALVRKRLPGPAALAKMRSEVEIPGRNQSEMRRRKLGPVTGTTIMNPPNIPSKKIGFLIERLCDVEEENKTLKEILLKKDDEIHSSQIICAETASKLSMIEAQIGELSKGQKSMDLAVCSPTSKAISPTSSFGISNCEIDHSESWASASMSEHKTFGVSDMSLMDDFVEMEKLAIVTVDNPFGTSYASSDASNGLAISSESTGQCYDWLQDVLKLILDQNHLSKRSFDDLLEDIRVSLSYMKPSCVGEVNKKESPKLLGPSNPVPVTGYITWKPPNTSTRVTNNCKLSQDVFTEGEKVEKEFGSDRSLGAIELTGLLASANGQKCMLELEKTLSDLQEENMGLKDELKNMESLRKDLEAGLKLANDKNEALMNQLQESEQSIGSLHAELETLKESKRMVEDQIENQKLVNDDLDTQLTVSKVKLNEVLQKLSSFEVELEDKSHCCEDLEATCLELQLQLESATNKEVPKDSLDQEERLLQTGWEIKAASAKLVECQETILNLGKQIKALSSPGETSVLEKSISTTSINDKKLIHRSSLRDRMLAEDDAEAKDPNSRKEEKVRSTSEAENPSIVQYQAFIGSKHESHDAATVGSLAIVMTKKRGVGLGFLRKLLMRKKRGSSKKPLSFAT